MPLSFLSPQKNISTSTPTTTTNEPSIEKKQSIPITFETLPPPITRLILDMCCPFLFRVRQCSTTWKSITDSYIDKRTKRWKTLCHEADAWGSRPPSLHDLIHHDPLLSSSILYQVYESKLYTSPKSRLTTSNKLMTFQKQILKLVQVAVDEYEKVSYCVPVLLRCVKRNRINFEVCCSESNSLQGEICDDDAVQLVEDENDDLLFPISTISLEQSKTTTTASVKTLKPVELTELITSTRNILFSSLCSELFVLACTKGNKWDIPALANLEPSAVFKTLCESVKSSIRNGSVVGVVACLEAAWFGNHLLPLLNFAIQQALLVPVWDGDDGIVDYRFCVIKILEYVFNDVGGPFRISERYRIERVQSLDILENEHQPLSVVEKMVVDAQELNQYARIEMKRQDGKYYFS